MDFETMKRIVDGAPKDGRYYCTTAKMYHSCVGLSGFECCVSIADLRTEPANMNQWIYALLIFRMVLLFWRSDDE